MEEMLPADAIRIKRRVYWHYGLYAGEITGKKMVFENTLKGVRLVTLEDFTGRGKCEFVPYRGSTERGEIIKRANFILGKKKYNLLKNNCEHFVTWCQDGKAKSLQVRTGIKLSGLALTAIGLGIAGKIVYDRIKKRKVVY